MWIYVKYGMLAAAATATVMIGTRVAEKIVDAVKA